MKISTAFPSKFLTAQDLGGRQWELTMMSVQMEDVGGETKPVLYFHGAEKGLVINKTNAEMITLMYTDETNAWSGQKLVIKPDKTQFGGRIVDCIRVVWSQHGTQLAPAAQPPIAAALAPLGNGAAPASPAPTQQFPSAQPSGSPLGSDPLDGDAIPF